jgi:hypothetical protein
MLTRHTFDKLVMRKMWCRDMLEELMDDEDEMRDMNLSSRPGREEKRRVRERDRLEREMERRVCASAVLHCLCFCSPALPNMPAAVCCEEIRCYCIMNMYNRYGHEKVLSGGHKHVVHIFMPVRLTSCRC